jgi:uncharacterized membrane protein (Fun14 family)
MERIEIPIPSLWNTALKSVLLLVGIYLLTQDRLAVAQQGMVLNWRSITRKTQQSLLYLGSMLFMNTAFNLNFSLAGTVKTLAGNYQA